MERSTVDAFCDELGCGFRFKNDINDITYKDDIHDVTLTINAVPPPIEIPKPAPVENVYISVNGEKDTYVTLRGSMEVSKIAVNGKEGVVYSGNVDKEIKYSLKGDEEIFNVKFQDKEVSTFGFRYDRCQACGDPVHLCKPPCVKNDIP